MATRVGCNGCHGKDVGGRLFHEDARVGRIVAPNLTQRRGRYDDAGLVALIRKGRTHDGHRPIGMPVHMFQFLSDREMRDVVAWLRAVPAIANPDLPEGAWSKQLQRQIIEGTYPEDDDMADPDNVPPAAPPSGALELGRHLAMTSCPECHGRDLNGWGPEDDAPSLIVAKAYTPEAFVRLMKTGITSTGKDSATGLMSEIARSRFAGLTDEEVRALKLYLDSR